MILEELSEHCWEILHAIRSNPNTQSHSSACRNAQSNSETEDRHCTFARLLARP
jgi:hypothetical protein